MNSSFRRLVNIISLLIGYLLTIVNVYLMVLIRLHKDYLVTFNQNRYLRTPFQLNHCQHFVQRFRSTFVCFTDCPAHTVQQYPYCLVSKAAREVLGSPNLLQWSGWQWNVENKISSGKRIFWLIPLLYWI